MVGGRSLLRYYLELNPSFDSVSPETVGVGVRGGSETGTTSGLTPGARTNGRDGWCRVE